MTRTELIERLATQHDQLSPLLIKKIVQSIFENMTLALMQQRRIEIRGFGCFVVSLKPSKSMRNPKTREVVASQLGCAIRFKMGKMLQNRVQISEGV
jgi:integration host factor subunit beta